MEDLLMFSQSGIEYLPLPLGQASFQKKTILGQSLQVQRSGESFGQEEKQSYFLPVVQNDRI